jgi:hypothetical protein
VRILGINVKADTAYLAVAEDSKIIDLGPGQLTLPSGVEESHRLAVFQDEVRRLLESMEISKVYVLEAEVTYTASYKAFLPRITLETLILTAADNYGQRMTRARCRSFLDLPKSGPLASHVESVSPQVGKAWREKRGLAALAALAGQKEMN